MALLSPIAEQASATEQVSRSSNGIKDLLEAFSVSKEVSLRIAYSLMASVPDELG
jgi:hypothetical protein